MFKKKIIVVIIVSLITIIMVPIGINIIRYIKLNTYKENSINYLTKIEDDILARNLFSNLPFEDGIYIINKDITADVYGEKPEDGWIEIKEKVVTKCNLKYDKYIVKCNGSSSNISLSEGILDKAPNIIKPISLLSTIFYDPINNIKCDKVYYNKGKTCYKFYILNIKDTTTDLLLDHNIKDNVIYSSISSNEPLEANNALYEITSNWNNNLNVRLPSIDEYKTYLNIDFTDNITLSNKYANIGDNLRSCNLYNCDNINDSNGYWLIGSNDEKVYSVVSNKLLKIVTNYPSETSIGIRPIITIDKKIIDI